MSEPDYWLTGIFALALIGATLRFLYTLGRLGRMDLDVGPEDEDE